MSGTDTVAVNPDGIGEILLTPYYTVQGGRNTLLDITNTDTVNGKVVKVRFRAARNGDDVFNFYVFLSPGEDWRARVYPDGQLVKLDVSGSSACTLPQRSEFQNASFNTARVFEHRPGEVREGYVSMITAANIIPGSALFNAIKHDPVTGVATCSPMPIREAMVPLTTVEAANKAGLDFPTTGLMGQWAITRVATNSTVSGTMTALQAQDGHKLIPGDIVVAPQSAQVVPADWVTQGSEAQGTADPLLLRAKTPDGQAQPAPLVARFYDFPDLSTTYVDGPYKYGFPFTWPISMLSANMGVVSLSNEFTTGVANFRTDWVFSMPTLRFEAGVDYAHKKLIFSPDWLINIFTPKNTSLVEQGGVPTVQVEVQGRLRAMNRGGAAATFAAGGINGLAGDVSVVSFNRNTAGSVLGAELTALDVSPRHNNEAIDSGWGQVTFPHSSDAVDCGASGCGLPVIGYAVASAGNRNLGFTWSHHYVGNGFARE